MTTSAAAFTMQKSDTGALRIRLFNRLFKIRHNSPIFDTDERWAAPKTQNWPNMPQNAPKRNVCQEMPQKSNFEIGPQSLGLLIQYRNLPGLHVLSGHMGLPGLLDVKGLLESI